MSLPRVALAAALFSGLLVTGEAAAQCGANRTTCSACHDGVRSPGPSDAAWHHDHAFADLCPVCHGGAGDDPGEAAAHVGLVSPLGDAEVRCRTCHGASTTAFVARYRCLPLASDAGSAAPVSAAARPPLTLAGFAAKSHGDPSRNRAMTLVVVAVGVAAAVHVLRTERARRLDRAPSGP